MTKYLYKRLGILGVGLFSLTYFALICPVLAEDKSITINSDKTTYEVGQRIEIKVNINTGGEKVGTIGFDIDFPTEIIEGSTPQTAGSVFPMPGGTQSSTRYECGIVGKDGFTGTGLVTTLVYTAKTVGTAKISIQNFEAHFGPVGAAVTGFAQGDMTITVIAAGASPGGTDTTVTGPSEKIAPQESKNKPSADAMAVPVQKTITPGSTKGSAVQTPGKIGSNKEDPIKKATENANITVKGFSFKNPMVYGFFPTVLLLALVINLGIKLYFTEKRRHLELVHLFDTQIGALSSLESKLDLVDGKNEEGKQRILEEFEQAKEQITAQEKTKLSKA